LDFAVVLDMVTIGTTFVTTVDREQNATELFHMDGKEHPGTLNPGVALAARWVSANIIETKGKKDGQDVAL
jgi:hypothetical protein